MLSWMRRLSIKSCLKKLSKQHEARERGQSDADSERLLSNRLAALYEKALGDLNISYPRMRMREAYRSAATLGDAEAQYQVGRLFLEEGRFWVELSEGPLFHESHRLYKEQAFKEAFFYLNEAIASGHALAKRLLGMAHIHGWGVAVNTQEGFKHVVESIDMEQAWDRSTKIIESLGLNSPEFFSALMTFKRERES